MNQPRVSLHVIFFIKNKISIFHTINRMTREYHHHHVIYDRIEEEKIVGEC